MRSIIFAAAAIMAVFLCAQANALSCGPRVMVLAVLVENGQPLIEQGVDNKSGVYVGVSANPLTAEWTFIMSPAKQPRVLCIVGTGTRWTIKETSSTGILHDGSVISIAIDNGDWVLIYMQAGLAAPPKESITGHGWERLGKDA